MSGRQRRNRSGMKRIISGRRSVHPEEPGENRRRQGRRCGNPVLLILLAVVILCGGGAGLVRLLHPRDETMKTAPVEPVRDKGAESRNAAETVRGMETEAAALPQGFAGDPRTRPVGQEMTDDKAGNAGGEGVLDRSVSPKARQKFCRLKGDGSDRVTVMIYLFGTDSETPAGMAAEDLKEMTAADLGHLNVVVFTGGGPGWETSVIRSSVNQIYQIQNGGLRCLEENAGTGKLTDPATLSGFIRWAARKFPADRSGLILWDHGGGPLRGYGYDGTTEEGLTLPELRTALDGGGVKFDFIGCDACLAATAGQALALAPCADYLIASEETEPECGWDYTEWLNALARNPSMKTIELGKTICDSYSRACGRICPGLPMTLSVTDLAEFSATVPDALGRFAESVTKSIQTGGYTGIAGARSRSLSFALVTGSDQIDLADFADRVGSAEGQSLASAVRSAVKYQVMNHAAGASGIAVCFPYHDPEQSDALIRLLRGLSADGRCVRAVQTFRETEENGRDASGSDPFISLSGRAPVAEADRKESSSEKESAEATLPADSRAETDRDAEAAVTEKPEGITHGKTASEGALGSDDFLWKMTEEGTETISLTEAQWERIQTIDRCTWLEDRAGWLLMSSVNGADFDGEGRLLGKKSESLICVNGQKAALEYLGTETDGISYIVTGRIACRVNGRRSELIAVFDAAYPEGRVAGIQPLYADGETGMAAKTQLTLNEGDVITLLADRVTGSGRLLQDSEIGTPITWHQKDGLTLSDAAAGQRAVTLYRFTDDRDGTFWSSALSK